MEFREDAPHEAGFAPVFADHVWPVFARSRAEAARKSRTAARLGWALAGLGVIVGGAIIALDPLDAGGVSTFFGIFIGLFIGLIGRAIWEAKRRGFNDAIKAQVLPELVRFTGVTRHQADPGAFFLDLKTLAENRMFARFSRGVVQDGFEGTWRGVDYRMAELRLTRTERYREDGKSRTRTITLFAGLCLQMEVPREVPLIRIEPRTRWQGHRKLRDGALQPVDLGTGPGAEVFQVFSDAPEAARQVISGLFLDALREVALAQGLEPAAICAWFRGRRFQLLISDRRSFLELDAFAVTGEAFRASVRAALADLVLARVIVDRLVDGPEGRG